MYSSSTILVFTMGDGVNGFTLDPQIGEFVMTHPNIQVPKRGKVRRVCSLRVRFRQYWDLQRKETLVITKRSGRGLSLKTLTLNSPILYFIQYGSSLELRRLQYRDAAASSSCSLPGVIMCAPPFTPRSMGNMF